MKSFIQYLNESSIHPKAGSRGQDVRIEYPSQSSPLENWNHPDKVGGVAPGEYGAVPNQLNGLQFTKAETPDNWSGVEGQGSFSEPEMKSEFGMKKASGVVVKEGDKVWVIHPTNEFGGYSATFPKGTLEPNLNSRENAIKEVQEESGLRVALDKHIGDFRRTTSVARYYSGHRVGGHPADMGWESQKVSLVPIKDLHKVVTHPADQPLVQMIQSGQV